jgi:flagellar hook assembly protein FlgD
MAQAGQRDGQLQAQDPLNPSSSSDFVGQLAQFSALEQTSQTNTKLDEIATGQVSAMRATFAGFVGKSITAKSNSVTLTGSPTPPQVTAHVDASQSGVSLVVKDSAGNAVRTMTLPPLTAGDQSIAFDGKDDKGAVLPSGDYTIALVDKNGKALSNGYAAVKGVITGLDYLTDGPHTVRGLAAELNVSKPAITRALDRLGELDLARRKVDPMDRRSILVQRTLKGTAFLRDMRQIMVEAEQNTRDMPAASGEAANGEPTGSSRKAG